MKTPMKTPPVNLDEVRQLIRERRDKERVGSLGDNQTWALEQRKKATTDTLERMADELARLRGV